MNECVTVIAIMLNGAWISIIPGTYKILLEEKSETFGRLPCFIANLAHSEEMIIGATTKVTALRVIPDDQATS